MNKLPKHMTETHEIRDGFIIKKGETDPAIFAAMESIKADMLREAADRKRIREQDQRREWFSKWNETSNHDGGQWGIWNISDRH